VSVFRRSRRRGGSPGFTLIELIVAATLSTVVLLGVFSILSSMVTSEINGMRSGTVTAWSLAGINVMNSDIAGAGAIGYPAVGGTANYLVVCTNWSTRTTPPAVVQANAGNTVYEYCWDTMDAAPLADTLLRDVTVHAGGAEACPAAPIMPCSAATYGGQGNIVATGVYQDLASDPVFYTDSKTMNAVRIRFNVGSPNASTMSAGGNGGTVTPVPVTIPFNTEIILED
jgi:type II secretory pathway pseudopilin PulG